MSWQKLSENNKQMITVTEDTFCKSIAGQKIKVLKRVILKICFKKDHLKLIIIFIKIGINFNEQTHWISNFYSGFRCL
jgi:hypothetical protein